MSIFNFGKNISSQDINYSPEQNKTYNEIFNKPDNSSVDSKLLMGKLPLNQDVIVDLPRLSHLRINKLDVSNASKDIHTTAEKVVDSVLALTGENQNVTQKLLKLLQQWWVTTLYKSITGNDSNKLLSKVEDHHSINIENGEFEVIHEALYKTKDVGDPTDESKFGYLKAKIVITGSIKDLEDGKTQNFKTRILNTAEKKTLQDARNTSYGWLSKTNETMIEKA